MWTVMAGLVLFVDLPFLQAVAELLSKCCMFMGLMNTSNLLKEGLDNAAGEAV